MDSIRKGRGARGAIFFIGGMELKASGGAWEPWLSLATGLK